jgi:acetylglutamate kinase
MRVKMEQIHDLLMDLPPSSSLSITKPDEMAKELFMIAYLEYYSPIR